MQSNRADSSAASSQDSLWVIVHERDDPMVLTQTQMAREDASVTLRNLLNEHARGGLHVEPPDINGEIGMRYDVSDSSGWFATYWLSEAQLSSDDGMLTAIVSPGAMQRGHHIHPRR